MPGLHGAAAARLCSRMRPPQQHSPRDGDTCQRRRRVAGLRAMVHRDHQLLTPLEIQAKVRKALQHA